MTWKLLTLVSRLPIADPWHLVALSLNSFSTICRSPDLSTVVCTAQQNATLTFEFNVVVPQNTGLPARLTEFYHYKVLKKFWTKMTRPCKICSILLKRGVKVWVSHWNLSSPKPETKNSIDKALLKEQYEKLQRIPSASHLQIVQKESILYYSDLPYVSHLLYLKRTKLPVKMS